MSTLALGRFICQKCALSLVGTSRTRIASFRARRKLQTRHSSDNHHGVRRDRPLRLAVIGSGPAGFYAAYKVLSKVENAIVDMYEKLPVPYGLVRFGVAPDHPEVKEKFTEVATSPRFNYVGNIAVGHDLPLQSLKPHYDAILLAYGASKDRTLNVPGEFTIKGIYSARAFVGWYDGLPEYAHLAPDLTAGEEAVIIGQGNVAVDVARILLMDVDVLRKTDITEYALETLSKSRVKKVSIVGRRGPMQAAFSLKEIREVMNLRSVGFSPIDASLLPPDLSKLPRPGRRRAQFLSKGSITPAADAQKSWELRFFLSPTSCQASPENSQLSGITFEKMAINGSDQFERTASVHGTGELLELPASFAFRSIGYKCEPLPGLSEFNVSFDERLGIIPNDVHGRVLSAPADKESSLLAKHIPGFYVAGWSKRGPTGVIASTMEDAFATANIIAQDWHDRAKFLNHDRDDGGSTGLGWDGVKEEAEKRGLRRVSWEDWEKIDAAEIQRGKELGKQREKFSSVKEMLEILD